MRILVVCDFLLKYGSQQARSLAEAGHDTAILIRSHTMEFGGSAAERTAHLASLRRDGVAVFEIPGRVRSLSALPTLWGVRRRLHRWRPDIVHAHNNHDPRLLALTAGYPTVLTIHDPSLHPGDRPWEGLDAFIYQRWINRTSAFVVHGPSLAGELAQVIGPAKIVVIPHGTTPRAEPLPAPSEPCLLFFGRLERYKGLEVLVGAMETVWAARPEVRLAVAGSGRLGAVVPDDPRVTLDERYIPESEVDTLFAAASLVVLPYTHASQSGVGVLAIAAGVPVVVSDMGALPELAYDPTFVARAGNPAELAAVITRHLDDGDDVRQAVLAHANARFSWAHAAALSTELYLEVISAARR
jgi:glycosyltransferase involved in cell wall biosynthesis